MPAGEAGHEGAIDGGVDPRQRQQRPWSRGEGEATIGSGVVERSHAEPVSCQMQPSRALVEGRYREVAVGAGEDVHEGLASKPRGQHHRFGLRRRLCEHAQAKVAGDDAQHLAGRNLYRTKRQRPPRSRRQEHP